MEINETDEQPFKCGTFPKSIPMTEEFYSPIDEQVANILKNPEKYPDVQLPPDICERGAHERACRFEARRQYALNWEYHFNDRYRDWLEERKDAVIVDDRYERHLKGGIQLFMGKEEMQGFRYWGQLQSYMVEGDPYVVRELSDRKCHATYREVMLIEVNLRSFWQFV